MGASRTCLIGPTVTVRLCACHPRRQRGADRGSGHSLSPCPNSPVGVRWEQFFHQETLGSVGRVSDCHDLGRGCYWHMPRDAANTVWCIGGPHTRNYVVYNIHSAEPEKPWDSPIPGPAGKVGSPKAPLLGNRALEACCPCCPSLEGQHSRCTPGSPSGGSRASHLGIHWTRQECAPQPTLLSNFREKLIKCFKRLVNCNFRCT